jgi:hypothetical protein
MPRVYAQQVDAERGIGDRKSEGPAVEGDRHRRGHDGHEQHRAEQDRPEGGLVGVEQVGRVGVRRPGPPHGHDQARERDGATGRDVLVQPRGELCDRDDEDQIEEQLGPRRMTLDGLHVRLLEPEPRRKEGTLQAAHQPIVALRPRTLDAAIPRVPARAH